MWDVEHRKPQEVGFKMYQVPSSPCFFKRPSAELLGLMNVSPRIWSVV